MKLNIFVSWETHRNTFHKYSGELYIHIRINGGEIWQSIKFIVVNLRTLTNKSETVICYREGISLILNAKIDKDKLQNV